MRTFLMSACLAAVAVATASTSLAQHAHEGDIIVGLNTDTPAPGAQYVIENGFSGDIALVPNSFAPFSGYLLDEPGFAGNGEDEPDEGFFALPGDAHVFVELLSIDPALRMYDDLLNELTPGSTWSLSPSVGDPGDFDIHGFWHIDNTHPAFVLGATYELTYRVFDPTGIYAPSDPQTLTFIPEPGSAVLAALGVLAALRRRS